MVLPSGVGQPAGAVSTWNWLVHGTLTCTLVLSPRDRSHGPIRQALEKRCRVHPNGCISVNSSPCSVHFPTFYLMFIFLKPSLSCGAPRDIQSSGRKRSLCPLPWGFWVWLGQEAGKGPETAGTKKNLMPRHLRSRCYDVVVGYEFALNRE